MIIKNLLGKSLGPARRRSSIRRPVDSRRIHSSAAAAPPLTPTTAAAATSESSAIRCSGTGLRPIILMDAPEILAVRIREDLHLSKPPSPSRIIAGISSASDVHELLKCPVCKDSMYPPIQQCPNGHTLCSSCKASVRNRCPTCHLELGNIRCLALEKVAKSLELPCRYRNQGCARILPYYTKQDHEQQCMFRPYDCPHVGSECRLVGDIPTLVDHLREYHKVDMHEGCTFNHRYVKPDPSEAENATWMLTVFNCFGRYFCLHFEAFLLGTVPVYMAFLRFMGEDDEAKGFGYILEVGRDGRKLKWQGVPRSIREGHRTVRDSNDGLIVHRSMALFFSGGNKQELKLRVTGRIWKEEQ